MSGRDDQTRGGGGGGRTGARVSTRSNKSRNTSNKKPPRHTNPIPGLEKFIFDAGKAEHAALFSETWERLCNRRRQLGEKEGNTMARAMEEFTAAVIPIPDPPPATIDDPNKPGNDIANP